MEVFWNKYQAYSNSAACGIYERIDAGEFRGTPSPNVMAELSDCFDRAMGAYEAINVLTPRQQNLLMRDITALGRLYKRMRLNLASEAVGDDQPIKKTGLKFTEVVGISHTRSMQRLLDLKGWIQNSQMTLLCPFGPAVDPLTDPWLKQLPRLLREIGCPRNYRKAVNAKLTQHLPGIISNLDTMLTTLPSNRVIRLDIPIRAWMDWNQEGESVTFQFMVPFRLVGPDAGAPAIFALVLPLTIDCATLSLWKGLAVLDGLYCRIDQLLMAHQPD